MREHGRAIAVGRLLRRLTLVVVGGLLASLLAAQPALASVEGDQLFSGPLGHLLALSELQADPGLEVQQLPVDSLVVEGVARDAALYQVSAATLERPLYGSVVALDNSTTLLSLLDIETMSVDSWEVTPTGTNMLFDGAIVSMNPAVCAAATGAIGSVLQNGFSYCTSAGVYGLLVCGAVVGVAAYLVCGATATGFAQGATCTSERLQWYETTTDPTGATKCHQANNSRTTLVAVRDIVLKPTLCQDPSSPDCKYFDGTTFRTHTVSFRLRTLWPDGTFSPSAGYEYHSTSRNQPKHLAVTQRSMTLPRGGYLLVVGAEESGKINNLLSSGWLASKIYTAYENY